MRITRAVVAGFLALAMPDMAQAQEGAVPALTQEGFTPAGEALDDDFDNFDQEFETVSDSSTAVPAFDPLKGYNRFMFAFNDKFYFWVAKPIARGYGYVVPEAGRSALARVFHNFHFPLRFANSFLQLKFKQSGVELGRFVFNTVWGLGGLFDPAGKYFGLRSHDEDFGQTLGYYGVGEGFPIVLPLLGPSNLRDMIGLVPDYYSNPLVYAASDETTLVVGTGEALNRTSLDIGKYESLKKDALDPYTFIRDAYQQNRNQKIRE